MTDTLQTLEYVAATLKLRHNDQATDADVEKALMLAKETISSRAEDPGLVTLLWDFIENGMGSHDFFALREKVRASARHNPLQEALKGVLPYAENELASLQESQRRDGGLEDEVAACEAAVERAQAVCQPKRGRQV